MDKESTSFCKSSFCINKNKYSLKISPIYKTFKVINYFQLKSKTPEYRFNEIGLMKRIL